MFSSSCQPCNRCRILSAKEFHVHWLIGGQSVFTAGRWLALTFLRNQFKVKSRFVVSVISGFVSTRLASAQDAGSDREETRNELHRPATNLAVSMVQLVTSVLSAALIALTRNSVGFTWLSLPSLSTRPKWPPVQLTAASSTSQRVHFSCKTTNYSSVHLHISRIWLVKAANSKILNGGSACTKRRKISKLLNGGQLKDTKRRKISKLLNGGQLKDTKRWKIQRY